ncbi:hypothetical protein [Pasteurella multocida]|uniref:hypothetical protein n=1 Tax=Pasteurella multocida TaxID=747 RepID=UPI002C9804B8|nr:hypothetical protein [Pasteurella multocida]MEB3457351.1 hypothetical protein [Pasteurella multocida]
MENNDKKDFGGLIVSVVYYAFKSISFWFLSIAFTVGYLYVGSYLDVLENRNTYGEWRYKPTHGLCVESRNFWKDEFGVNHPYMIVDVEFPRIFEKEYIFKRCSYEQYTLDKPEVDKIRLYNDAKDRDRELFYDIKIFYIKTKIYVIIAFIMMLMFVGPRVDQYIKERIPKQ